MLLKAQLAFSYGNLIFVRMQFHLFVMLQINNFRFATVISRVLRTNNYLYRVVPGWLYVKQTIVSSP